MTTEHGLGGNQQLLRTGKFGPPPAGKRDAAGTLVIDVEPAFDRPPPPMWTRDGRLLTPPGRYLLPGVLPAGQWGCRSRRCLPPTGRRTRRFLVESAEYDVENGRWTLQSPKSGRTRSTWERSRVRHGTQVFVRVQELTPYVVEDIRKGCH